jgi:6-phosphogluconate dehydrogenase
MVAFLAGGSLAKTAVAFYILAYFNTALGAFGVVTVRSTPETDLSNLLLDPDLGRRVTERQSDLRDIIKTAVLWGIPVPGFMACLPYFDAYRCARLPANLIQAQRDYFGAHTYQRIDSEGVFHTEWT